MSIKAVKGYGTLFFRSVKLRYPLCTRTLKLRNSLYPYHHVLYPYTRRVQNSLFTYPYTLFLYIYPRVYCTVYKQLFCTIEFLHLSPPCFPKSSIFCKKLGCCTRTRTTNTKFLCTRTRTRTHNLVPVHCTHTLGYKYWYGIYFVHRFIAFFKQFRLETEEGTDPRHVPCTRAEYCTGLYHVPGYGYN